MRGHSFSPLYWRAFHFALLDLVRQLGYPRVFFTLSPYEWTFPYHEFVRDEMNKLLRARLRLPLPEILHISHVLLQTAKGLLFGDTGKRAEWRSHVFHPTPGRRVCGVLRLEFQDGSRKAPTQGYHGSGRPHLHVLIFCDKERLAALDVPSLFKATAPDPKTAPDLAGYVQGSQHDRHMDARGRWVCESGQDLREEPTQWDEARGVWRLQHCAADKEAGLRGYIPEVMDVLRCHQDFQFCDDDSMLRKYVAKYVAKFSDAASDEWLNDDNSALTIAVNVLSRYRPMEPEMVLQLFGARFRQWHISTASGGKRDFIVPWPDKEPQPKEIALYEAAEWARGKISLLDFLRKTNREGGVAHWLRRKHAAEAGAGEALESFAAKYVMQGEAVVSAEMLSRLNDRFFGQWLVLHVPFRRIADFANKPELRRVPPGHRYFAMALLCDHPLAMEMWRGGEDKLRAEMKDEAHTGDCADGVANMVRANRGLVEDYIRGVLVVGPAEAPGADSGRPAAQLGHEWDPAQSRFKRKLEAMAARALALESAETEAEADAVRAQEAKICVCLGPPGSGKTTIAHAVVENVLERGGRVLFACPTAQLASRMRERYRGSVDADTCHAAFGFGKELGAAGVPLDFYALIVVDEISQLDGPQFEHICALWRVSGCAPAMAVLGDKWQMAGLGATRPWETRAWSALTFRTELHRMYRCTDKRFEKLLNQLRTGKPDLAALKLLKTRLAWPAGPPSAEVLRKLFKAHPGANVLTCSRRGAAEVNQRALEGLFPHYAPMVVLDGDLAANPDNYDAGQLRPHGRLAPLPVPIYPGMQLYLTANVRKDLDFVNGMRAEVLGYTARSGGLRVRTATDLVLEVWKWTDVERGGHAVYPIRPGYASTILKFQGAELDYVVVYLDCAKIPGAAYTALSRVHRLEEFKVAARVPLTDLHFTPAR